MKVLCFKITPGTLNTLNIDWCRLHFCRNKSLVLNPFESEMLLMLLYNACMSIMAGQAIFHDCLKMYCIHYMMAVCITYSLKRTLAILLTFSLSLPYYGSTRKKIQIFMSLIEHRTWEFLSYIPSKTLTYHN